MTPEETPLFTVSQISTTLKDVVETAFAHVRVKGEVSGVKKAASGHIYFSLKDEQSVLNAICWRGCSRETGNALTDGLEVICTGHLSTYPGRSNYQMIVETAEAAGEGALLKLLEERRRKLAAEGLFDASRKKKIPFLPETIGVVTSPTGAVIRDIMHRIRDRFGRQVYLWPVLVQGEGAAQQIATAIQGFNNIPIEGLTTPNGFIPRPDVLIVARGGGSLEDLWPFNEEIVVRAAAASQIPLISAVGHETDTTLIDYAADLRAPTPTGAAEKAVPVRAEIKAALDGTKGRLKDALQRLVLEKRVRMEGLVRGLPNLADLTHLYTQRLDDKTEQLTQTWNAFIRRQTDRFALAARLLEANSYERTLDKGFALVADTAGGLITSAATAQTKAALTLTFKDGRLTVAPKRPKTSPLSIEQGDLFSK